MVIAPLLYLPVKGRFETPPTQIETQIFNQAIQKYEIVNPKTKHFNTFSTKSNSSVIDTSGPRLATGPALLT